jgi:thiosulfate dehydrogenase
MKRQVLNIKIRQQNRGHGKVVFPKGVLSLFLVFSFVLSSCAKHPASVPISKSSSASLKKTHPKFLSQLTEKMYGLKVIPENKAYQGISIRALSAFKHPTGKTSQEEKKIPLIQYGFKIFNNTPKEMGGKIVGDLLSCGSCHLKDGRAPFGTSLVGVVNRYPRYSPRDKRVIGLKQRIEECFERSENGKEISKTGKAMKALLAYFAYISRNTPPGTIGYGYGLKPLLLKGALSLKRFKPSLKIGEKLFVVNCSKCHGLKGQGGMDQKANLFAPPLWGKQSFNTGAGFNKLKKLIPFVQANMPYGHGGTLTPEQAEEIAGFVLSHPRPALHP